MKIKKVVKLLIMVVLILTIVACSNDESTGKVRISAKASNNSITTKSVSTVTISKFLLNVIEIEFEIEDDFQGNDDTQEENLYSELEMEGPFLLDLSNTNTATIITSVEVPNNVYNELEFDISPNNDTSNEMFGKSILINGEINGVPFEFWHNAEEEFDIDYEDSLLNIIVDANTINTTINFDISTVFGATSSIDFSNAKDIDNDGIIEINPNNDDGNADLADLILDLLEESTDLSDD